MQLFQPIFSIAKFQNNNTKLFAFSNIHIKIAIGGIPRILSIFSDLTTKMYPKRREGFGLGVNLSHKFIKLWE